jgi:hypothetical protein
MEDPPSWRDGVTIRTLTNRLLLLSLGLTALGAPPATAQDLKELVSPYLKARDELSVGEVAGRAYTDPQHPTAPDVPREGVSVLLFPYSVGFESDLDAVKEHLRDSLNTYMSAAADVTSARTAYEESLIWAGGGEFVRGEVSDAKGLVRLTGVPAGEWLLLAWREDPHPSRAAKLRPQETKGFADIPVSAGYSLVTFWWMRVQVRPGETTSVEFNDRNTWITAVRQNVYLMRAPARAPTPSRRR